MTFILKNPGNSMTSAKRSNVQTKPNKHIMTDDFRISELVTLARGSGQCVKCFLFCDIVHCASLVSVVITLF